MLRVSTTHLPTATTRERGAALGPPRLQWHLTVHILLSRTSEMSPLNPRGPSYPFSLRASSCWVMDGNLTTPILCFLQLLAVSLQTMSPRRFPYTFPPHTQAGRAQGTSLPAELTFSTASVVHGPMGCRRPPRTFSGLRPGARSQANSQVTSPQPPPLWEPGP